MNDQNTIEIKLSKVKLAFIFLGSLIFVGLGIWFLIDADSISTDRHTSSTKICMIGISSVIFFGLVGFFVFRKLFSQGPGLIISDLGVTDHSGGFKIGFIPWSDVIEIRESSIRNQKFLHLVVKNPQDYIDKQENMIRKKLLQFSSNQSGLISNISTNGLQIKHKELKLLIEQKFNEYKTKHYSKQSNKPGNHLNI